MHPVLSLAAKDLRLLVRDKGGFFFVFFFPCLYAVFFGLIFSGQGGDPDPIRLIVVDEDQTEGSQKLLQRLEDTGSLELVPVDTPEQAGNLVRRGKAIAFLVLPQGFGAASERMFFGEPAKVQVGGDPARTAELAMLQGLLMQATFEGMQDLFDDPSKMIDNVDEALADLLAADDVDDEDRGILEPFFKSMRTFFDRMDDLGDDEESDGSGPTAEAAEPDGDAGPAFQPVVVETVPITREWNGPDSSFEISFPQGIIWGVLGCAAGFGLSLVIERTRGTLLRLRVSPLSQMQILAGKALACFVTILAVCTLLLVAGRLFFEVIPTSTPLLALAIISIAICFVGIMMFLSVLGRTEAAAGGIGWAINIVMAMLGGGMVPLFVMPRWMQQLGNVSPVKWSIQAMEGALWRDFTLAEMLVPCGLLVTIGILCFTIGVLVFRRIR